MSVTSIDDEPHLHRCLNRLDGLIRNEFEYVGHRLTWLLTSHSFLFTAFVVGLNVAVQNPPGVQPRSNSIDAANVIPFFLETLCFIGIASSLFALVGIVVAHLVVCTNYERRNAAETLGTIICPGKFDLYASKQDLRYWVGSLSGLLMPVGLAIAWILLFQRL